MTGGYRKLHDELHNSYSSQNIDIYFWGDNPIKGYEIGRTYISMHAWDRPDVHKKFSLEHPKERDH